MCEIRPISGCDTITCGMMGPWWNPLRTLSALQAIYVENMPSWLLRHTKCHELIGPGRCGWNSKSFTAWWRHQMERFSALLAICAGNLPVPSEFPTQRPVTRSFDVYFDLRHSKWLSKQSWGWWFETPSSPLWRHRNGTVASALAVKLLFGECHKTPLMM